MDVKAGRYTANDPDDVVVFFLRMRIDQLRRVNEWVPVMRAVFATTKEVEEMPDAPLLKSRTLLTVSDRRAPMFVQCWRSFDDLDEWANNQDRLHRPAQREVVRRTAYNGHVGVWNETYRVKAGEYEAIYANMPRMGLAAAGEYRDLRPTSTMRDRVGTTNAH